MKYVFEIENLKLHVQKREKVERHAARQILDIRHLSDAPSVLIVHNL
jgi:hypothetical protein